MSPKTLGILNVVFGGLGALAVIVTAVDAIKNGDKRAAITGDAAGRAATDEMAKRYHKTLGGALLDD